MELCKLKNYINKKTLLGIGPVSINCVNASIEIANEYNVPVMLIPSRRQIDNKNIKRGYVNNWSTEEFASYVRKNNTQNNIILARDHGGPWQNNIEIEKKMTLNEAMASAKESYERDIDAGFQILHIDPSIDIYNELSEDKIFNNLFELYDFCSSYASQKQADIEFEVGTEEQIINLNTTVNLYSTLRKINEFCDNNNYKIPLFVVIQIGTKVLETQNIGILNQENNNSQISEIIKLINMCHENNYHIKVHNTDYLRDDILTEFPKIGINAANVAPEFGVCETMSLIELFEKYKMFDFENKFLELSYNSRKWDKWLLPDSSSSNKDKAIISGHYIFSTEEFKDLKDKAQNKLCKSNIDIDTYLKNKVKNRILKYMNLLGMITITEKEETPC